MWAIKNNDTLRHCYGGGSVPVALCGYDAHTNYPLDYVKGSGLPKCKTCQKILGEKREKNGTIPEPTV